MITKDSMRAGAHLVARIVEMKNSRGHDITPVAPAYKHIYRAKTIWTNPGLIVLTILMAQEPDGIDRSYHIFTNSRYKLSGKNGEKRIGELEKKDQPISS